MKALLPAAAFLGLLSVSAAAQQVTPESKRIGDFAVRCFPVKSVAPCDMFEEQVNRDTGQRAVSFSLAFMPAGSRYILQLSVPLAISIEKGVVVAGASYTSPVLPYRRCDASACFVEAAIPKDMVDSFARLGSKSEIRVVPDGSDKSVALPFSFDGFTAALDEMMASNKAKATSPDQLQAPAAAPAK